MVDLLRYPVVVGRFQGYDERRDPISTSGGKFFSRFVDTV
jgi:hypothetical protein